MPCLFALLGAIAPRLAIFILWIFTPVVERVFDGWLFPLLGTIFLPFTTLLYLLVAYDTGSINFWGWLTILLGLLIDAQGYFNAYNNRQYVSGMSSSPSTI
jgi:hypothetical protein